MANNAEQLWERRWRAARRENERLRKECNALRHALLTVMGDMTHGQRETWQERCRQAREIVKEYPADHPVEGDLGTIPL